MPGSPPSALTAIAVGAVALFFLIIGVVSLADPAYTLSYFRMDALTAEMRNEVRAVYGGFGVAIGLLLFATFRLTSFARGVYVAVAAAAMGMAAGRVYSFALERPDGIYPLVFLGAEIIIAATLLIAARR